MTNEQRSNRAFEALQAYAGTEKLDLECHVSDLICDLLHYARVNDLEPDITLRSAVSNFVSEAIAAENGFGPRVITTVEFLS